MRRAAMRRSSAANPEAPFTFRDPGPLRDGDLTLFLDYRSPADPGRGWIPAYHFSLRVGGRRIGGIELRVDLGGKLDRSTGHFGYFVEPACRGRGYAARAGRLLLPLARAHGLDPIWILCAADNAASRRTCERLGAVLVAGEGGPCRYRLDLAPRGGGGAGLTGGGTAGRGSIGR